MGWSLPPLALSLLLLKTALCQKSQTSGNRRTESFGSTDVDSRVAWIKNHKPGCLAGNPVFLWLQAAPRGDGGRRRGQRGYL